MPANPNTRTPAPIKRASREVADHVKAWRKLNGLTQSQLADRAGLERKTIARLENNEAGVSMDALLRVLHALGVLSSVTRAVDPYETDIGRLRAEEQLPERVRPRPLSAV